MQILIQCTISLAKYSMEDIQYVLVKAIQGLLQLLYTKNNLSPKRQNVKFGHSDRWAGNIIWFPRFRRCAMRVETVSIEFRTEMYEVQGCTTYISIRNSILISYNSHGPSPRPCESNHLPSHIPQGTSLTSFFFFFVGWLQEPNQIDLIGDRTRDLHKNNDFEEAKTFHASPEDALKTPRS